MADEITAINQLRRKALSKELVTAYEQAIYEVTLPDQNIRITPGEKSTDLDKLTGAKTWMLITAHNPRSETHSDRSNQLLNESLQQLLQLKGYTLFPGLGRSECGQWQEASFLVMDVDLRFAESLAVVYGQNAILYGEPGSAAQLIYCL